MFCSALALGSRRPNLFPAASKELDPATHANFESAKDKYCGAFAGGLLTKVSFQIQSSPVFVRQKELWTEFCKLKADGTFEFVGLAKADDGAANKFVLDVLTYERLVEGVGRLRSLTTGGPDSIKLKSIHIALMEFRSEKLFWGIEYDAAAIPTKAKGLFVDLFEAKMSHPEIANKLFELRSWITSQVKLAASQQSS